MGGGRGGAAVKSQERSGGGGLIKVETKHAKWKGGDFG